MKRDHRSSKCLEEAGNKNNPLPFEGGATVLNVKMSERHFHARGFDV